MSLWAHQPDDFFSEFFRPMTVATRDDANRSVAPFVRKMAIDVKETEDGFHVAADLPGLSKEDIKVEIDKDVLRIGVEKEAEKEEEKEEEGVKWHRWERSSAFTSRAIRMPESANLAEVKAKYDNGVLTLDVPKRSETKKPRTVAIE